MFAVTFSHDLLFINHLRSLLRTSLEQGKVLHDKPHVLDWQINNHAGDFGRLGNTDKVKNVLVNYVPDLVPVVRILRDHSWEDLLTRN